MREAWSRTGWSIRNTTPSKWEAYFRERAITVIRKIADGIYFAITREDALEFSRTDHGHAYTHLLTCRIKDLSKGDLVDLTADESLFVRLKPPANSPLFGLKGRALHTKYCEIHRKKGILWRARRRWTELCLLKAFAKDSVIIEAVDALGR